MDVDSVSMDVTALAPRHEKHRRDNRRQRANAARCCADYAGRILMTQQIFAAFMLHTTPQWLCSWSDREAKGAQ